MCLPHGYVTVILKYFYNLLLSLNVFFYLKTDQLEKRSVRYLRFDYARPKFGLIFMKFIEGNHPTVPNANCGEGSAIFRDVWASSFDDFSPQKSWDGPAHTTSLTNHAKVPGR